ncbi:YebC/PmpR family DNA-binding transcriptional regulator [Bythopirellula polymerisocia]|uniref:Probable transcriptional regulatory protein Pla144_44520 n=1 Tax=Bythopirellula polymerisocia TaxID=2528003 RepID=A0A5C6CD54_9BACT|nr:YebC/PmpR family DNA-binding transcriptional regulator [Bythopirellula polymerisocia]TWU21985.1 putative transcriptional regulatory protein [Bythopirellula polymerisocia]
MAGHSHWANIAHKKSLIDAKRGKLWSKLSKAIIIAARDGGGDPGMNLRLRYAINDAKAISMPKDNIERAIKKGTGELEGGSLDSVLYEGYGPGGVAVLCEILTDNRNRTAPEVRKIFELAGGKLGATGCVAWMFDRKGLLVIEKSQTEEESLLELALDAGAEDVKTFDDSYEIISDPDVFGAICEAVDAAGICTQSREITRIPQDTVDLDVETARAVLKMMEALDDHDDVQTVSANFNIPDEAMAELEE